VEAVLGATASVGAPAQSAAAALLPWTEGHHRRVVAALAPVETVRVCYVCGAWACPVVLRHAENEIAAGRPRLRHSRADSASVRRSRLSNQGRVAALRPALLRTKGNAAVLSVRNHLVSQRPGRRTEDSRAVRCCRRVRVATAVGCVRLLRLWWLVSAASVGSLFATRAVHVRAARQLVHQAARLDVEVAQRHRLGRHRACL
jgi:hypothetical protein